MVVSSREMEPSPTASSFRKRKRSKSSPRLNHWAHAPSFMDASASVSAGIFSSRRLPELQDLYESLASTATTPMVTKTRGVPTVRPLQSGGCQTSRRHLRRRTTANQTRKHRHRFPRGKEDSVVSTTRKGRRSRKATLYEGHYQWQEEDDEEQTRKDDLNRTTTSRAVRVNWILTHVWHAKRFHMETLWDWRIPLVHTNRGPKAILRLLLSGNYCSLQDVTWQRGTPFNISVVSSAANSFMMLRRICPDFGLDPATLCGSQMGCSILHDPDRFPSNAIGPVYWKISIRKLHDHQRQQKEATTIQFWASHPSIRPLLGACLKQVIQESNGYLAWENKQQAPAMAACIRVCGKNATEILSQTLGLKGVESAQQKPWKWKWDQVVQLEQDDAKPSTKVVPPHGSVVWARVANNNSNSTPADGGTIMLVRHAPRPLDCPANYAVAGWDLYCSSGDDTIAHTVWMALALQGKCCPIGMVEEIHLQLECQPPIPVFPRDYVDTSQSKLYYNHDNTGSEQSSSLSWKLVRQLYEGGWGRLPIPKRTKNKNEWKIVNKQSFSSSWADLLDPEYDGSGDDSKEEDEGSTLSEAANDSSAGCEEFGFVLDGSSSSPATKVVTAPGSDSDSGNDNASNGNNATTAVVVVRGVFGQPFVDAVQGCGRIPAASSSIHPKQMATRRNRRRTKPLYQVVPAEPLSRGEEASTWRQTCASLLSSLSLPAVLICHIRIRDRGIIEAGSKVWSMASDEGGDNTQCLLGYATAGSFSLTRGTYHGIAVVGAAALLKALASMTGSNHGQIVRLPNQRRQIELLVTTKTRQSENCATLSVII